MLTITVPSEIELAIVEKARLSGVTPEEIALQSLREVLLPDTAARPAGDRSQDAVGRMGGADYLLGMAGIFHSGIDDTSADPRSVVAAEVAQKHGF